MEKSDYPDCLLLKPYVKSSSRLRFQVCNQGIVKQCIGIKTDETKYDKKKALADICKGFCLEARAGVEPTYTDLQSGA
ncbi:hypothetical protein, partial [Aquitalea pelogenes]|uniref:hypothetical protein n=1 Tax=Aquitalea pelogenes TaxID=1293573 RepID=UPI0035B1EC9E